jgi:hypothetical protein
MRSTILIFGFLTTLLLLMRQLVKYSFFYIADSLYVKVGFFALIFALIGFGLHYFSIKKRNGILILRKPVG